VIFASEARIAVLRVFTLDPFRAYYQRQIEAATGLPIRAVQRELLRLAAIGFLYRREEGNRTYYQVNTQFALFPELRSIILKMAEPGDRLRGQLAMDESVRLAFLCESEGRALVVTSGGKRPSLTAPGPFVIDVMSSEEFTRVLAGNPESLESFLAHGVDLLARREDVIWRRIEAAGYAVEKGKGVP
jgi:DNA-binding transcriptional ArsR family regulator